MEILPRVISTLELCCWFRTFRICPKTDEVSTLEQQKRERKRLLREISNAQPVGLGADWVE